MALCHDQSAKASGSLITGMMDEHAKLKFPVEWARDAGDLEGQRHINDKVSGFLEAYVNCPAMFIDQDLRHRQVR